MVDERLIYNMKDLESQADFMGIYDWINEPNRCGASVIIQGKGYRCSLRVGHEGWAHQNLEMEVMWK